MLDSQQPAQKARAGVHFPPDLLDRKQDGAVDAAQPGPRPAPLVLKSGQESDKGKGTETGGTER